MTSSILPLGSIPGTAPNFLFQTAMADIAVTMEVVKMVLQAVGEQHRELNETIMQNIVETLKAHTAASIKASIVFEEKAKAHLSNFNTQRQIAAF